MPQGKRGKFTIPGQETHRNRIIAKTLTQKKKNMGFNVGFQPYADHDIYRAIIFFNYMTFVEQIFYSYQGGPYSPTVHITPNSPNTEVGVRILRKSWFFRPNWGV